MITKCELEKLFGYAMENVAFATYESYIKNNWNHYSSGYAHGSLAVAGEALGMSIKQYMEVYDQQEIMVRLGQ